MSESDKKACEVPFLELLDKVPADVRVHIDTPNSLGVDTEIIPVGIYCRRAAAEIRELRRMISELRKEETNLNELLNACYISPENRHPVARLNHAHGVSRPRASLDQSHRLCHG